MTAIMTIEYGGMAFAFIYKHISHVVVYIPKCLRLNFVGYFHFCISTRSPLLHSIHIILHANSLFCILIESCSVFWTCDTFVCVIQIPENWQNMINNNNSYDKMVIRLRAQLYECVQFVADLCLIHFPFISYMCLHIQKQKQNIISLIK